MQITIELMHIMTMRYQVTRDQERGRGASLVFIQLVRNTDACPSHLPSVCCVTTVVTLMVNVGVDPPFVDTVVAVGVPVGVPVVTTVVAFDGV